jgi:hypothetical protein
MAKKTKKFINYEDKKGILLSLLYLKFEIARADMPDVKKYIEHALLQLLAHFDENELTFEEKESLRFFIDLPVPDQKSQLEEVINLLGKEFSSQLN